MTRDTPTDADEILANFLDRIELGDAPDVATLAAEHPGAADDLMALAEGLERFGSLLGLAAASHLSTITVTPFQPDRDSATRGVEQFNYDFIRLLGQGGMGEVWLVRQSGTAREVAMKRIRADALDADMTKRFLNEVYSLSKLAHPHVVGIYHVGMVNNQPFFTMPYLRGGTLEDRLDEYRSDFGVTARLLAKVARGVHHAHTMAVIHRDLKPANILIDDKGEPVVADFGLGGAGGGGTPPWMAPEGLRAGEIQTTKVDVWALGVILYELLTGRRPFPGSTRQDVLRAIQHDAPPTPRSINPDVPADLEAISLKCLCTDPTYRYESASAIALELDRWLNDEPVRARVPSFRERAARFVRKHRQVVWGGIAFGVLILIAFVTGSMFIRDQDQRLRNAVCENNAYTATQVATAFGDQITQLKWAVERAAGDPALAETCRGGDASRMKEHLRGLARASGGSAGPGFASVFVLDQQGTLRAVWPEQEQVVGRNFAHRDYFHGALAHAAREGVGRVHVSRVYTSVNDHLDKFAVSVAFYRDGHDGPVWVLAATVRAHDTLGLSGLHNSQHQVALLAPRENAGPSSDGASDRYVVLVHPAFESPPPSGSIADIELRRDFSPLGEVSFTPDDDYRDPVAEKYPRYAGRWLAGFSPVADTGLVVLAQQRYEGAVAPHLSLFYIYLIYLAGAATLVVLAVAVAVLVTARPRRLAARRPVPRPSPDDSSGAPLGDGVYTAGTVGGGRRPPHTKENHS
jgi:hypothetical protein